MIKLIPDDAWPAMGRNPLEQVKVAASGLRGTDLAEFVKRASHPLATWVQRNPPKPGEVYVHSIAMGATEKYGANRNADGYSSVMLERDAPTFEKYARWYRLHKNQDPKKSYGVVKRAFYNPDLFRIEVITALNGTKEAAERNGGLVADKELDTLNSNRDLAVSQSVKVSYDVCEGCGNKARNRTEYCGPEMCKYGGCRDHLGKTFEDGFHLFVDNPFGSFFDLSNVSKDLGSRGADRTAFVTGKVAAADRIPGGAELADLLGLVAPDYLLEPHTLKAAACLRKLAAHKVPYSGGAPTWDQALAVRAGLAKTQAKVAVAPRDDFGRQALLAELSEDGVILPPAQWLALTTGSPAEKCAAVFAGGLDPERDLLKRADLHDVLGAQPTNAADIRISPKGCYSWMGPSAAAFGKEAALRCLHPEPVVKVAACPPNVRETAAAYYLAYQAATLARHEGSQNFPLMLAECIHHNKGLTA